MPFRTVEKVNILEFLATRRGAGVQLYVATETKETKETTVIDVTTFVPATYYYDESFKDHIVYGVDVMWANKSAILELLEDTDTGNLSAFIYFPEDEAIVKKFKEQLDEVSQTEVQGYIKTPREMANIIIKALSRLGGR